MAIETKDLWQGAYLLAEGGWLDGVKVNRRSDGKKEVLFRLTGNGVEEEARRFLDGNATCNVRKLRHHVNYLKDLIFGGRREPWQTPNGCPDNPPQAVRTYDSQDAGQETNGR